MNKLRSIVACVVVLCICASAFATSTTKKTYWIYFRDKGIAADELKPGSDLHKRILTGLSPRTLQRRPVHEQVTLDVIPVYEPYIASLQSYGVRPRAVSKWLNAITASLNDEEVERIKSLSFVGRIERSALAEAQTIAAAQSPVFVSPLSYSGVPTPQALAIPCGYDPIITHLGLTQSQLTRIGVFPLHAMGFDASGIAIGFTDTGFNFEGMRTTRDRNIIATYDFVFKDSIVHDDASDPVAADDHGSVSLSTAIGYLPDSIIGPAYNAAVYLAKTEDLRSETPAEEGYYAQALEWFEAQGVDITSNSLGYISYDSGYQSITYPMLNGRTTAAARAALMAARRGMLVVTSAGNGGTSGFPYIVTPADADSILAVGMLFENDSISPASSHGPTPDGRIKPDITAPGAGVWSMGRRDDIKAVGGTSFATPLVSGACALVMQAHPEASAQAVRSAVLATGTRQQPPDNVWGYGKLNAYGAALALGTVIGPHKQWREDSIHHICVGIAANNAVKFPRIVYAIDDNVFIHARSLSLVTDSLIYSTTFPAMRKGKRIRYYIETQDGADTVTRSPRNAPLTFYEFNVGDTTIVDTSLSVVPNGAEAVSVYPNPAREKFIVTSSFAQPVRYQLIDIAGKPVLEFESTAYTSRIEVQFGSLPSGVYTLHGQLGDGSTVIRQTIVHLQ